MATNPDNFLNQIFILIKNITKEIRIQEEDMRKDREKREKMISLDSLVLIVIDTLITNFNLNAPKLHAKNELSSIIDIEKDLFSKFLTEDFFLACKNMITSNKSENKTSYLYVISILIINYFSLFF